MIRFPYRKAAMLAGLALALGGCDLVKSWFPDKQKQYQYSTEIPPLEIPPDLSSSTIDGVAPRPRAPRGETEDEALRASAGEETAETRPGEGEPANAGASEEPRPVAKRSRTEPIPTLAQSSDNVPLIEIEAPFEVAWIAVAKALGRLELEISDQNRSDGVYYVYYGGDAKPYEDRGFFGDLAEMFGKGGEQSKEYRIKLEEKGKATLVYVLDPDNKPQMSGPGFDLLKRLHETLQSVTGARKGEASAAGAEPGSEGAQ